MGVATPLVMTTLLSTDAYRYDSTVSQGCAISLYSLVLDGMRATE